MWSMLRGEFLTLRKMIWMLQDQIENSDAKQELVTFAKLDNSGVYSSWFINNHLLSLRVQKLCMF